MNSIGGFATDALDAIYNRTAGRMLSQIATIANKPTGRMQLALRRLEEEANRLKADNKKMTADNPVLVATMAEYETLMNTTASIIQANDNAIQDAGLIIASAAVSAKVFLPLASQIINEGGNPVSPQAMKIYAKQAASAGVKWNTLGTLEQVTRFIDSPAWIARMEKWGKGYADLMRAVILQDIQNGAGPVSIASHLRKIAQNMSVSASENITRTLQLTSYREASLAMEKINGGFIVGKIRIAALDNRTCLTCIALHGTPLELGQRVDDHYRGRCTEYYQVPGGDPFPKFMQSDSLPGQRNFVPFQSGNDWFASLPKERQALQASFLNSPAKMRAYTAGTPLSGFVGDHVDDVFGNQKIERSLVDMFGTGAEKYYTVNQ